MASILSKYNSLWRSVPSCSRLTFIVFIWKTLGHIPPSYPHDDIKSLFFPVASDIFPLASQRAGQKSSASIHCPKSISVSINSALSTFFLNIKVVEAYCCFLGLRVLRQWFMYHRVRVGNMAKNITFFFFFFRKDGDVQSYDSFSCRLSRPILQILSSKTPLTFKIFSFVFHGSKKVIQVLEWYEGEIRLLGEPSL